MVPQACGTQRATGGELALAKGSWGNHRGQPNGVWFAARRFIISWKNKKKKKKRTTGLPSGEGQRREKGTRRWVSGLLITCPELLTKKGKKKKKKTSKWFYQTTTLKDFSRIRARGDKGTQANRGRQREETRHRTSFEKRSPGPPSRKKKPAL